MKPAPFEYVAPQSLPDALAAMAAFASRGVDFKLLAGGQSLLPVMNFRLAQPAALIDLNRVAELDFLRTDADGSLRIGAMTRQRRLERDPQVARHAPLLAEALPWVAHPQIRNRGTLGGSLAHADPAAELPAVTLALDARYRLLSSRGERWLEAKQFFSGLFSTALEAGEILVEIALPRLAQRTQRTGWAFLEVARRHGDYAQVGVAARVTLGEDGRCESARLVYLSVADTPFDAVEAARGLVGQTLTPDVLAAVAVAARSEVEPTGDIHASAAFKRHLAEVVTRRALRTATERAAAAADAAGVAA
jgi:carbon-monoxide dehydrogenase medium subunit